MTPLEILRYPDERLKQKSKSIEKVTPELLEFIALLEYTMRNGPPSVGIAAPQVGRFERVVIIDCSFKKKIKQHGRLVLINPEVVSNEGSVVGREGCLSVPDYTGNVERAEQITLTALDESGTQQSWEMEGYEARAALHEIDHLDGLLFLDRLVSRRDLFKRKVYK